MAGVVSLGLRCELVRPLPRDSKRLPDLLPGHAGSPEINGGLGAHLPKNLHLSVVFVGSHSRTVAHLKYLCKSIDNRLFMPYYSPIRCPLGLGEQNGRGTKVSPKAQSP